MAALNGLLLSLFHESVKVALVAVAKRPRAFQRAHVFDRIPGAGPVPHGVVCLSGVQVVSVQEPTRSPANRPRQVIAILEQYEDGYGIQEIADRHDPSRSTV